MKVSRKGRRKVLLAGLGGMTAQFGSRAAAAQDAAKVMPRAYRVVLDNEHVRVLDFVGRPGMGICGDGMHSHPPGLTIVMTDWTGVTTTPTGDARQAQRKAGDVQWREAPVTHKVENTGRASARVLIVELKALDKPRS
jgi:quercetin dioxygenase-like cupin family protein